MKTNIPNNDFSKESLKKQFRLSEFLAEKIISSVAYTSIAIIVLIFVFVFKEALPIFNFRKASKAKTEISNNNNLKPETYGAETTEVLKPEVYGTETTSEPATLKPETYGDLVANEAQPTEEIRESENQGADNTWSSFLTTEWVPVSDNPRFGLIALLLGTLKVTIIAMLFAGPLGVLAALYTSAFASKKAKEIIKPLIELLAAFPSVVIGFFALMILATFFQDVFGYETRLNAFVGGVAMALAAIPIIYTISEDALSAVPKTYTEASLALGASKWQTAFFVTLPAAIPGIFAAILLGIGRVFGETMIALMATGNAALNTASPFESVRTFAATIGSEMAETVFGDTHYSVLFFIGSLLFIFSFGLNALAEFYVKGKLIKKIQGK
ncbi:ABC-type phosphate-transport system, permease component PstC [Flavobacterium psychrophilum]|uniref:phosphate ABC transporter permease subunit PstC n=1 Tax=Flavobacterium psychrophilum TaxID=96345 RepID=UPI000B7C2220|nr:phosphate ABC transporter permease subunit PstC [Flavobacterium psychrophilum]SNB19661.1 ABC-type phosphate-transport system, permease component PstC [Flavobacterium psychrophilum]SNB97771.1 ABC-type phosphate-transport system, permease component PstC [Flavobacterium psychrophilum]